MERRLTRADVGYDSHGIDARRVGGVRIVETNRLVEPWAGRNGLILIGRPVDLCHTKASMLFGAYPPEGNAPRKKIRTRSRRNASSRSAPDLWAT